MDLINNYSSLLVSMVLGAVLGLAMYLPLMAGQLSLATAGFYTLGGYTAAIMSSWGDGANLLFVFLEMLVAGGGCAVLAIILGLPVLRLQGVYLAIATIAFGEILRIICLNLEVTGGAVGIFGIAQPFDSQLGYLWLALPTLIGSMALVYRLERIKAGRAMQAIRSDQLAAATLGINPSYYKLIAFTLGAVLAAIAGVISAHFLNTWNARQGTFDTSITHLAFVLLGGARTFVGPVFGGMVLTALPEALRTLSGISGIPLWLGQFLRDGRLVIFGLLIVVGSIFYPKGLITPQLLGRWGRPN